VNYVKLQENSDVNLLFRRKEGWRREVIKNLKMPTGDVEIFVNELNILSRSELPPFTIEDVTDGGEELRMKYRYWTFGVLLSEIISFYVTGLQRRPENIWMNKDSFEIETLF